MPVAGRPLDAKQQAVSSGRARARLRIFDGLPVRDFDTAVEAEAKQTPEREKKLCQNSIRIWRGFEHSSVWDGMQPEPEPQRKTSALGDQFSSLCVTAHLRNSTKKFEISKMVKTMAYPLALSRATIGDQRAWQCAGHGVYAVGPPGPRLWPETGPNRNASERW